MPAYTPTDWVDGITPVNAANMDKLEAGVQAAAAGNPPTPLVEGNWLKVQGGAMVWAPLPTLSNTVVMYVSAAGADANDGLSWGTAKRQIDAAFAALPAGGGTIHVDAGNYAPFTLTDAKSRVSVIGHGAVRIAPTGSQIGITISGAGGSPIVGPLIEGIHVDGDGEAGNTLAIRLIGMTRATIRRCRISNCYTGIQLYNDAGLYTERNSVQNTTINNCSIGVQFWRTATGHTSFSYNRFLNVGVDNCLLVGWDLGSQGAAVPDLFGSSFTGCACWLQDANTRGVIVACNMLGVLAHIDVEWQVGAGAIGWDVLAAATNLDNCTLQSVMIGNWTSATKVALAAGKVIRFLPDNDLIELRSLGEGLRGQTFDRSGGVQGAFALTAGTLQGMAIPLRQGDVVTGIVLGISVNGTGVTLFKVGLYNGATPAAKLAESAESSSLVTSGTVVRGQGFNLTTPYVVPADGLYNLVVLSVGGTSPTVARGVNLAASSFKIGSGHFPHWQSAGGQTDLQAVHNQNQSGIAVWMGWY